MRYTIFVACCLIGLFNQGEAGVLDSLDQTSLTKIIAINPATGACVTALVPSAISSSGLQSALTALLQQTGSLGNFNLNPQGGNANVNGTSLIPAPAGITCTDIKNLVGFPQVTPSILTSILSSVFGTAPATRKDLLVTILLGMVTHFFCSLPGSVCWIGEFWIARCCFQRPYICTARKVNVSAQKTQINSQHNSQNITMLP